jgi:asparagine synthase (glutamine-hydrolysing)
MFRYVALIWAAAEAEQNQAAQTLTRRLRTLPRRWREMGERVGLRVFYTDDPNASLSAQRLPLDAGVILGTLFERHRDAEDESPAAKWSANAAAAEKILASRGRWLIDNCWGNYVAVLQAATPQRSWVLKDPTGTLPCFSTDFRGVCVVFSDVADLVATGVFDFAPRPEYLRARLLHGAVVDQSPLENVEQVYRGECLEIDSGTRTRTFCWHPSTFAESDDPIEDAGYAARALRATVLSCTRTLSAQHNSILHRLSGGLDSSIIAACLQNAPNEPRICCYTYYTPGGRSDERPWARIAAEAAGHEHVEWPITPRDICLEQALDMPLSVEPAAAMGYVHRNAVERAIACERAATAVFCGDGGDSGFCADSCVYAVSEYLHRHGLRAEAFRLAAQVALRMEQSTWSVLYRSIRRQLRGSGMEQQRAVVLTASRLLSRALLQTFSTYSHYPHPWFSAVDRVPWALIRRLGMLLSTPEFYNVAPGASAPEVVAPLYSQPAMELFLRIPLYRHFEDGRERGLARRAFVQDVPSQILRRTWKDRSPGAYDELVVRNRKFLRELLLGGVLMEEGLLDHAAVEDALSDRLSKSPVYPGEIFRHLDVEIWARAWLECRQQAAGQKIFASLT